MRNGCLFSWVLIFAFINAVSSCTTSADGEGQRPERHKLLFSTKGLALAAPIGEIDSAEFLPIVATHANSIAIMPYAFCSSLSPKVVFNHKRQWWGEKGVGVMKTILLAHNAGLSVMVKPHLWLPNGAYTGALTFQHAAERTVWEDSYREYILYFARLADSLHAETFCLGTELGLVVKEHPQYIEMLIDTLRSTFKGKLTYAANWDDYQAFPFWHRLDIIGVDAYFPLSDEATPSVAALRTGWQNLKQELKQVSDRYNKPLLFAEIGYRNADFAAKEPWSEQSINRNDVAQANCLEAFFDVFSSESWVEGAYLWKWYADQKQLHLTADVDFTPQGKKALDVIMKWF